MMPFEVALPHPDLALVGAPALSDNYVWLLHSRASEETLVIDPGEGEPVRAALRSRGWQADHIWITHWHPDHVGGIAALRAAFPDATVIGPAAEADRIADLDDFVEPGTAMLSFDEHDADVIATPGHTAGHIAYHLPSAGLLFCGDTMFAMGCGRLFEGTPADMHASLGRLAALPDDTLVCAAHEYTASNARFSVAQAPGDAAIAERLAEVEALRREDRPTLPTTIARERATNLFLRAPDVTSFAALRAAKDRAQRCVHRQGISLTPPPFACHTPPVLFVAGDKAVSHQTARRPSHRRAMSGLSLLLAPMLLAGCTSGDTGPRQFEPLSPQAMRQMDRLLAGKTAGEPTSCISGFNDREMIRISDDTVLYRVSSNLVYRNDLRFRCPGLANGNDVVVHRKLGTTSSCSGDIIQLVDRNSGIPGGSCVLGDFVPYRSAR